MSFLYKKCKKIRPYVISEISLVKEYMDALKDYSGSLDDNSVYDIIKETYLGMMERGEDYRTARDVINKVSKDVMGSSEAWKR